eukprot:759057-Hanusia_phi.AAC.4
MHDNVHTRRPTIRAPASGSRMEKLSRVPINHQTVETIVMRMKKRGMRSKRMRPEKGMEQETLVGRKPRRQGTANEEVDMCENEDAAVSLVRMYWNRCDDRKMRRSGPNSPATTRSRVAEIGLILSSKDHREMSSSQIDLEARISSRLISRAVAAA